MPSDHGRTDELPLPTQLLPGQGNAVDLVAAGLQSHFGQGLSPWLYAQGFTVRGQRYLVRFAAEIQNGAEGKGFALEQVVLESAGAVGID